MKLSLILAITIMLSGCGGIKFRGEPITKAGPQNPHEDFKTPIPNIYVQGKWK